MESFATVADGLVRASAFIRAGRDDRALRRAAEAGELARVIPGVFLPAGLWEAASAVEKHVLRARAFEPRLGERAVFSHGTAAAIHGWDRLGPALSLLDVTDADLTRTRRQAIAHLHAAAISGLDVDSCSGLPVTGVGRTAVDVVASLCFRDAVVVLDSALRAQRERQEGRSSRPGPSASPLLLRDFDAARERRSPVRNPHHVQSVRSFADGKSGSAGESLSRVVLEELGVARPVLQQPFFGPSDARGRRQKIGEVDFWWEEFGVVGEFDGYVKYSRPEYLRGRTPAQAAFDEKQREDRLRAHPDVKGFARWIWSDVMNPHRLEAIVVAAGVRK